MKTSLLLFAVCLASLGTGRAEKLPVILQKPFLGCFLGFSESRDFEFALGGDGSSELFFRKDNGTRLTTGGCTLHIHYVVEEKLKDRWVNRTMGEDGFETASAATDAPELEKPYSFVATYTGDTKVEITHLFRKDGVEIQTKLVEKKTENPVRVGVRVLVGDMYRHVREAELDERDLKDKVEDSEVTVWKVGSSSRSGDGIDFDEIEVNLEKKFPEGASKVALESDRLAEHEFTLSTADEDLGVFQFRQQKPIFHGFAIHWWPDPENMTDKDCRLLIEVD